MHQLFLVSKSPRRKQLLEVKGYLFRSDTVKVSEIIDKNVNLQEAVSKCASLKVKAYRELHKHLKSQPILMLSADTIVAIDGLILGKPESQNQAQEHLQRLSGRVHQVITGIYCVDLMDEKEVYAADVTKVEFFDLSQDQIKNYIASGEPMDKAGAYAIQGLGQSLVKKYEGSWSNVVGLPMELFEKVLRDNQWTLQKKFQR